MAKVESMSMLGVFLCFSAMVLLVFASISAPTWERISFLNVHMINGTTHYGVFGYTNHPVSVGYYFPIHDMNSSVLHNLTKTLILIPIGAGITGLAFISGLIGGACGLRAGAVLMSILASLSFLVTLVAWCLCMALFRIAQVKFRDRGFNAGLGNALWLGLGALVGTLGAFIACACGSVASLKRKNRSSVPP